MSCNCGILKTNLCQAGIFSVSKLAMSKPSEKIKKRVLTQTAVVGAGGIFFDKSLYSMFPQLQQYGSPLLIKSLYQIALLGVADVAMSKKLSMKECLNSSVSVLVGNYGVDAADGMQM